MFLCLSRKKNNCLSPFKEYLLSPPSLKDVPSMSFFVFFSRFLKLFKHLFWLYDLIIFKVSFSNVLQNFRKNYLLIDSEIIGKYSFGGEQWRIDFSMFWCTAISCNTPFKICHHQKYLDFLRLSVHVSTRLFIRKPFFSPDSQFS